MLLPTFAGSAFASSVAKRGDGDTDTHAARPGVHGGATVGHPSGAVLVQLLVLPIKGLLDGVQAEGTDG